MTVFYVVSSATDWTNYFVSHAEINNGANFACYDNRFVMADDNMGAFIMLLYTLVLFAYSCLLIYVFYVIPAEHGLAFGSALHSHETAFDLEQRNTL